MSTNIENIVSAIKANNNRVINDDTSTGPSMELAGLGIMERTGEAVALCNASHFQLNKVYLDDQGVPHASSECIPGTVMKGGFSLTEAVESYNATQDEYANGYHNICGVVLF